MAFSASMSTESLYAGGATSALVAGCGPVVLVAGCGPVVLVAGGAPVIRDGTSGHDGVTIVTIGDSLLEVDLLLILIVLPVAGCKVVLLFNRQTPNRHMTMMPAIAARLIMSGNFTFSKNGVVNDGGISLSRLLLMNLVEFIFTFSSSKCSSSTSIRFCSTCISSGLLELNFTESQFIFSERMLHVNGSLIFA